ncbi:MAG TPA: class I SAM-dependent methyltransferase [Pyrinomonadaceae bacterium]|jgi:SAM-dependent methyltransferase
MERRFAEQYGDLEEWHWWFRGRRKILEAILRDELREAEQRSILSVGCGPAHGLEWLIPFAGPKGQVVGLDLEPLHARQLPSQVKFVTGRLEQAPLADASFDLVLALDVLEHLDDDSAGLMEAVRLTRPGGLLLVTVPALPSLWGGQDVVSNHRRRYTERTLSGLFAGAKLAGYQVRYFNTLLFPLAASVRWSRRALGLANRPRSDFEDNRPGLFNELLARVFSAESRLIARVRMPVGVSLLARYSPPVKYSA